jgi:hypothetical protein
MVEVEKFPCKDSMESRARERFWCEQLNATLNSNKPYITDNELKEYFTEYYQNNKEYLTEYNNKYYQNNKEYFTEYNNKYYQNNKDKLLEYNKEYIKNYYQNNKQYLTEYKKQKQNCICSGKYTNSNKHKHLKSNKHIDFINKMETSSSTTTNTPTLK